MFQSLVDKMSQAFSKFRNKGKLTEADVKAGMREVKLALLEADVNFKVVKDFVAKVTERAVGSEVLESLVPSQQIVKIVNEELVALMGGTNSRLEVASKPPTVILMCGLQGSGKTTHCAKLGKMLKKSGKNVLLTACDIYRPAAIKQLQVVGEQAGLTVFERGTQDPVRTAEEAVKHAVKYGFDTVILDTAGRLHVDEALMAELKRIRDAVRPTEILLVVDSMTGQDAVNVAQSFNDLLDITGVILTKLDGDTRGGAALSVRHITGKPIKFVGVGEKLDDIEPFHPDRMASRILGMGDVLSLIEKAEQAFDEKKAADQVDGLGRVAARHDAGGQARRAQGREDRRKADRAHRGDHPLDDRARARAAGHHQLLPQEAHRRRQWHLGGGGQPPAQAVRADQGFDEALYGRQKKGQKGTYGVSLLNREKTKQHFWRKRIMAVKIRLRRMGAKKAPYYRVVVADSRYPRDGRFIEEIGTYNPLTDPATVTIDAEKAKAWIANGAQPTDTVKALLKKNGVL